MVIIMSERTKPIYHTDVVAAQRRFEEAKKRLMEQRKADEVHALIPQHHGSGMDADMVDNYHADDLFREMDAKIAGIRRGGHSGGGGGLSYRQVLSVGYFNV